MNTENIKEKINPFLQLGVCIINKADFGIFSIGIKLTRKMVSSWYSHISLAKNQNY